MPNRCLEAILRTRTSPCKTSAIMLRRSSALARRAVTVCDISPSLLAPRNEIVISECLHQESSRPDCHHTLLAHYTHSGCDACMTKHHMDFLPSDAAADCLFHLQGYQHSRRTCASESQAALVPGGSDKISLNGCIFHGFHGVLPEASDMKSMWQGPVMLLHHV